MLVDQFIENMKGKEITKQEGNLSPLIYFSILPGCFPPYSNRYFDLDFGPFVFLNKGDYGVLFFDLQKYFETSRLTFKKLSDYESVDVLPEMIELSEIWEHTDKIYEQYDPKALQNLSDENLQQLAELILDLCCRLLMVTVFSEGTGDEVIKELYEELQGQEKEWEKFWVHASSPAFMSVVLKEDELLLDMAEYADITFENVYRLQWLYTDYSVTPDLSDVMASFKNKISNKAELEKIRKEKKDKEKETAGLIKRGNSYRETLSEDMQRLYDYVQKVMYIRDRRKEPANKLFAVLSNMSREVLKRKGIPAEDAQYMIAPYDFTGRIYQKDNYRDVLEQRKKGIQIYIDKDGHQTEYGPIEAAKQKLYASMDAETAAKDEVKGSIACKGSAKGIVKVILSKEDFGRFKPGDVLVTSMTRPEFVPLMKQSAAVITDEGGLTCHAAIVSRELNLPCIIGTKNATRVLKDGDDVEVDADSGIVKIIKHDDE